MRFLLDQNQSPRVAELLVDAGQDAVHVRDLGLSEAPDVEIVAVALRDDRIVVSGDTDFGELLARSNAAKPSVVLLRRQDRRRGAEVAELLLLNVIDLEDELAAGAIVVLDQERLRVRRLPFRPPS